MSTTTRQHGTRITRSETPQERMDAIRAIHAAHQYAKVDGVMVDAVSASAIVAVYDALTEANRLKFIALPVARMATVAFRLCQ